MNLNLVSHINGDGDLLEAWFRHYLGMGVTSFHLIMHGARSENARLVALKDRFPVLIRDAYEGEYRSEEKKRRTDAVLASLTGQWVIVADSDEFVEFPFRRIGTTIRMLEVAGANALYAPMLQRLTRDGSLDTPAIVEDPFATFPRCSVSLYKTMGSAASIDKFPLFYCTRNTRLFDGGNHTPPQGERPAISTLRGVTHHFKFRGSLMRRLERRIHSSHSWRHESVEFLNYLDRHDHRLPLQNSFDYSRSELFRRGLLRRFPPRPGFHWVRQAVMQHLFVGVKVPH